MENTSIRIPNVFKIIGRTFSKKQSATYRAILMLFGNNPAWTRKDFAKLTEAGFMNCITVYACVSLIARSVARLPWVLYKKPMQSPGRKSKLERIEEHDLLNRIEKPNPMEGQASIDAMVASLLAERKDPKWYAKVDVPFNPVPLELGDEMGWKERLSPTLEITETGVIRDIKIDTINTIYVCECGT